MEPLLTFLKELPEYEALAAAIRQGGCAALSGLSPITRAHFIAALCRETGKPAFVLTQDDAAARTMQEALQSFLGEAPPLLPSRDLMFYDAAAVSRGWEQQRLSQLYRLATGKTRLLVASLPALTLRTLPKETLLSAAVSLAVGQSFPVEALSDRLTALGYSRCTLVEGPGQFALRGGHPRRLSALRRRAGARGVLRRRRGRHGKI